MTLTLWDLTPLFRQLETVQVSKFTLTKNTVLTQVTESSSVCVCDCVALSVCACVCWSVRVCGVVGCALWCVCGWWWLCVCVCVCVCVSVCVCVCVCVSVCVCL